MAQGHARQKIVPPQTAPPQDKSMNIVRNWRKFMAVGCSHGHLAKQENLDAVLLFKHSFRPETVIHLGDFWDLAALRSGAAGTPDDAVDIEHDLGAGMEFLKALEPQMIFVGNHEDRIYHKAASPRAEISYAAGKMIGQLNDFCSQMKAELVPYHIKTGWRKFGDTLFGHGYMFNEMFIRDHAETFGKCCIAHGHKVGQAEGRRSDNPVAYCVGTLADIPAMTYAKTKRALLSWSAGIGHGEYCDDETIVNLCRKSDSGEWRLPL